MVYATWVEPEEEIGADAEFSRGQAEVEGRVLFLRVLSSGDEVNCGLDQGFKVLWVRERATGHQIDDHLARAMTWLAAVDMGCVDRG
jgi:hypothetical protein